MVDLIYKDEAYAIVGAAIEVHRELGPGYIEAVYQDAMEMELRIRALPFRSQAELPIFYKRTPLKRTFICDLICYEKIIVELKAIDRIGGYEVAQTLNYLKASAFRLGLLINFGSHPVLEWRRLVV